MAKFGPGCGLVAWFSAQVGMFQNLAGDAAIIGKALAGALTGTLYGARCSKTSSPARSPKSWASRARKKRSRRKSSFKAC